MALLEDRRSNLRRPLRRSVTVFFGEWELEAICLNVSPTGCFLAGHGFPETGDPVILLFPADDYDAVIECVGVVKRVVLPGDPSGQAPGSGVQFVEAMCRDGMVTLGRFLALCGVEGIEEMWAGLERSAPRAPIYSYDFSARRMIGRLPLDGEEGSVHSGNKERVRMSMSFSFLDGKVNALGVLANISPNGAFIRSSHLPKLGARIHLVLPFKIGGAETIEAEVRWRSQTEANVGPNAGFGVRFLDREQWSVDPTAFHVFVSSLRK